MRILTWALDSWRTPAGKVIAVILSLALVFSCSNAFLASSRAYAAGNSEETEEVEGNASSDTENGGNTTFAAESDVKDIAAAVEDEEELVEGEVAAEEEAGPSDAGISRLALVDEPTTYAAGNYTVAEGDTLTITGTSGHSHSWSSSNASVATVKGSSSSATVKGVKAGTVTITHEYRSSWSWSSQTETFTVTVTNSDKATRVYVYIKIEGDTTGWTENTKGWCTIGYVDVPASELEAATIGATAAESIVTPYFGSLVRHDSNKNLSLDLNAVSWAKSTSPENGGLHAADGANDFAGVSGPAWHLDGYLYIANKYAVNYTVEGVDAAAAALTETKNTDIDNTGTDDVTGSAVSEVPGYEFQGWFKGDELVTTDLVLSAEAAAAAVNSGSSNGKVKYLDTTFTAKYAEKEYAITYEWSGDVPAGVELPTASNPYKYNDAYAVDKAFSAETVVEVSDDYGNVTERYTFSGWDAKDGFITSDLTISGTWSKEIVEVAKHNVVYSWSGLPAEPVDAAGNAIEAPAKPASLIDLVKGQPYTVDDTSYEPVYSTDEFGNVDTKYTFSRWTDPNNGTMGESDVTIEGVWTSESVEVATWTIAYDWGADAPEGVTLPTDDKEYKNNEPYAVDATYTKGYTVNTTDRYGNITGTYTFSGWDTADGIITENLTIKGEWTYTTATVAKHNVSYSWTGLPTDVTLYDADGNVIAPALPDSITGLVKNEPYVIDADMPGMTVYTQDGFGNQTASYTLGEWDDPNNGTMGEADVTVTAEWTSEPIEVAEYSVSYEWTGLPETIVNAAGEAVDAPAKPEGIIGLVKGQPYDVNDTFVNGYTIDSHDVFGNVNGTYTFSGWTDPNNGTMGEFDVIIEGEWTFSSEVVESYTVTYAWNLPTDVRFFDAEGAAIVAPSLPIDSNRYVNNQPYPVDSTEYPVVYAQDSFGNKTAEYIFEGWDKPGTQTMGTENVTINGTWVKTDVLVSTWTITYEWTGDIPAGVTLPTDTKTYLNNEPYTVDAAYTSATKIDITDDYGNITGTYTFSGWDTADGTITENLTIKGEWVYEEQVVETHEVTYEWTGLPEGSALYDEDGTEVEPALPDSITGLVKNEPYVIDADMPGMTVYTQDGFGNQTASYTLGAWDKAGEQTMGDADVTVRATWTQAPIDIPSYVVSYVYAGEVPAGAAALPVDASYVANQTVTIAAEPELAGWEFIGWTLNGNDAADFALAANQIPENKLVTLVGTWQAADVDAIEVDAVDVVYDGERHPLAVTGTLPADTILYTYTDGAAFDNDAVDVTDVTVVANVIRDGVLIWTQETTVRITPAPLSVKIVGNTAEVFYNSEVQAAEGYTYTVADAAGALDALPAGIELKGLGKAIAQGTNAGTYQMGLRGTSFWFSGENIDNYAIDLQITDGFLTIVPTPVMVIVGDATKVAGTADPTFTANVVPGVYNDEMSFTIVRPGAGADEAVGSYEDAIIATYAENPNYAVTVIPGTLTITAPAPTPTPITVVPGGPAPVTPPAPADGGAAPADAGTATVAAIDDDATPMAEGETIEDDATPLSAFDEPECWVHILMIIGIVLTIVYGLAVVGRRLGHTHEIDRMDKDLTVSKRSARKATHVRSRAHSA